MQISSFIFIWKIKQKAGLLFLQLYTFPESFNKIWQGSGSEFVSEFAVPYVSLQMFSYHCNTTNTKKCIAETKSARIIPTKTKRREK